MTFSLPHPSERATGVKTDGIGQKTTAHLNLTRTMAAAASREISIERRQVHRLRRQRELQADFKHPYAGKEQ